MSGGGGVSTDMLVLPTHFHQMKTKEWMIEICKREPTLNQLFGEEEPQQQQPQQQQGTKRPLPDDK